MTVKDIDDGNTMGRQDPPCRSPSAPATHPNAPAKPAPKVAAPAEKLPPARPAKTAPWSTKAMPTNPKYALSDRFAAERADALASCSAPIQQWAAIAPVTPIAEANLIFEQTYLNDVEDMASNAEKAKATLSNIESYIAGANRTVTEIAHGRAGRCLYQRRIAQLEGSPLAAGAVDGTLTPLSIGGQTPAWKQQGKDARVIASDGKSAMHCVKLEQIASGDSKISGGGRRFFNYCPESVEIVWCHTPGECERERGAMWTVRSNYGWPISSQGNVRWAACLGANTAAHVKGTFGLRYYCSAPAKK